MNGYTKLAKIIKQRDNVQYPSITTGIVISPPPQAKIQLNDATILENRHLVWSAHMLVDYERELESDGEIKFTDSDCGQTTTSASHSHGIQTVNIDTEFETKNVKITMKDTVIVGDEVILQPTIDNQLYFVIDKAVRFE